MDKEDRKIISDLKYEIVRTIVNYRAEHPEIKPKHVVKTLTRLAWDESSDLFKDN